MKLSEAIRLGAMLRPQGFGCTAFVRSDESCALGAALEAVGKRSVEYDGEKAFMVVKDEWPILETFVETPTAAFRQVRLRPKQIQFTDAVWRLNDIGKLTREQIADWVESVEQQIAVPAVEAVEAR